MMAYDIVLPLIICGILAGTVTGLFGSGGGAVAFVFFMAVFPKLGLVGNDLSCSVVGTSFVLSIPLMAVAGIAHMRSGQLEYKYVKVFLIPAVLGIVLSFFIVDYMPVLALKVVFTVFTFLFGTYVLFRNRIKRKFTLPNNKILMVIAFVAQAFAGTVSAGIGTILTPVLVLFQIPLNRAIAVTTVTAFLPMTIAGFMYAFIGFEQAKSLPYSFGYINLIACACVFPPVVICGYLGAKFTHIIRPGILNLCYAIVLFLLGINMIIFGIGI